MNVAQLIEYMVFLMNVKKDNNVKLWKIFVDLFNCLPIAGSIDDKILMIHGGLSPELKTVQLQKIMRPTDIPEEGLLCDILWSDTDESAKGGELMIEESALLLMKLF